MMRIKFERQEEKNKILIMAILLAICCFITYYYHKVLESGTVFTHFFYIPIILASVWWKRRGLTVAVFLGAWLIISHFFFRIGVETINDLIRAPMFIVISLVTAYLSEKIDKAYADIKKEKNFSENIITTVPDSLIVVDRDLRIKRVNLSFNKVFGLKPEKAIGTRITDILGNDKGKLITELTRLLGTKTVLENFELHYCSEKLGLPREAQRSTSWGDRIFNISARGIIVAENGEEEQDEVLIVVEDITEQKRAEEELKKHREHLEELVKERTGELGKINERLQEEIEERKRTEVELIKSEEKYRELVKTSLDGVISVDSQMRITLWNQGMEKIFGYTEEEMLGQSLNKITPKKYRKAQENGFAGFKKSGLGPVIGKTLELTGLRKDGTEVAIEISVSSREVDRTYIATAIVRDITERKRFEQLQGVIYKISDAVNTTESIDSLFRSIHNHLSTIINTNNVYIALYDEDKELISFPYFVDEKDSRPAPKKFGKGLTEYVIETGKAHYLTQESILKLAEQGKIKLLGAPSLIWLGVPLRIEGKIIGIVALQSYTDASIYTEKDLEILQYVSDQIAIAIDRKRAEEDLRKSEEKYRVTFESTGTAAIIIEEDTTISMINSQFEKLSGYSKEEIESKKSWTEFVVKDDLEKMKEHHRLRRIDPDNAPRNYEFHFIDRHGDIRDIFLTVAMIKGTKKSIAALLDITERKRAEEAKQALEAQLLQSQKLESIGTLASGVAHEINNPLMGMINYAELIKSRTKDDTLKEFSAGIIAEGDRVAKIVRNLLSFARQDKESHSPAQIKDIIDASLSLIGSVLRKDQITLTVDIPAGLPRVNKCRSQQIQQVIINLLTNARDALNERYPDYDENKIVRISAKPYENDGAEWIRTTVEDHGAGIPDDVAERIFEPFFTTKPRDVGTGLGLSVSYGLIKDHHGELSVESEPGKFTRFHIDLPVNNG